MLSTQSFRLKHKQSSEKLANLPQSILMEIQFTWLFERLGVELLVLEFNSHHPAAINLFKII